MVTKTSIRAFGRRLQAGVLLIVLSGCAASTAQTGAPASPAASRAASAAAPASECFPFERLPASLRTRATDLLLTALDGEALYTIVSDIKPMSSGFYSAQVPVENPDLREVEEVRQIFAAWTCGGEIRAIVHPFAAVYQDRRPVDAAVFNLPAFKRMLTDKAAFFGPYGISPSSDPVEVLMMVEHDDTSARLRGYGYFFGYPDYAVDFFARANDEQKATGAVTPRDFISLPTMRGERRFVYAAPKGHQPNAEDTALRAAAERVFEDYKARRARHITEGSSAGVLALLREWFDNGRGDVRPSNAWSGQGRR